jgi:hypothetical protein
LSNPRKASEPPKAIVRTFEQSSNVVSVMHIGTSEYCVELPASIDSTQTVALLTPYFGNDSTVTTGTGITTQVEYDGTCGRNGEEVLTYAVQNGVTVTANDEAFTVAVPKPAERLAGAPAWSAAPRPRLPRRRRNHRLARHAR